MGVNFSAIEIGRRALTAAQLGLTVAGQNIANVNTPGYSRQAVQLSATPATGSNLGLIGNGVTIEAVRTFRDRFIDVRLQTETGIGGRLTAERDALLPVDAALNESSGNGLSQALNNFFNAFTALEQNPNSIPLRTDIVAKGDVLAQTFVATRSRLVAIRSDADSALRDVVKNANELSDQISSLNVQIANAEVGNANASELRDQRAGLVQQLSELTGARAIEDSRGMVTMAIGDGRVLVSGDQAIHLQIQDQPPDGLATVMLAGQPAAIDDGRICGFQNAKTVVANLISSLDDLAASITARVNAVHTSGTDINGNPGGNFFNVPAAGSVTAANFSVSAAIKLDPRLVVASPLVGGATGTVAGAIGALLNDPTSTAGARTGSFSGIYATIVAEAGQSVKSADDALTNQAAIINQLTAQRDAVSGVSLDEEAVNLLQFQRAYEAAAKFLKIADEMTQTILALGN